MKHGSKESTHPSPGRRELRPAMETTASAPLDVDGAKLGLKRTQIVAAIRASRRK